MPLREGGPAGTALEVAEEGSPEEGSPEGDNPGEDNLEEDSPEVGSHLEEVPGRQEWC